MRAVRPRRRAPHQREIAALELALAAMIGELLGERAMRPVGLGDDEQAARVLVEAMHDARAAPRRRCLRGSPRNGRSAR